MDSNRLARGSFQGLSGICIAIVLAGIAWSAPPEKAPATSAAGKKSAAAEKPKSPAPRSNPGNGSVVGSVLQLFFGGGSSAQTTRSATVAVDEADAEAEVQIVTETAVRENPAEPWNLPGATHQQAQTVKIARKGSQSLQTFCVAPNGNLVAVVSAPRYGAEAAKGKNAGSELQLFDGDGTPLKQWEVEFGVQSVTATPAGEILAAGSGQLAKFSSEGELLKQVELQHVKAALGDPEKLCEDAEELLESQQAQLEAFYKQQKDELQQRIDDLKAEEAKAEDGKLSKSKARQLAAAERSLKNIVDQQKRQENRQSVDDVIRSITSRLKIVNAITSSGDDVFIATGVTNGYGYAVWRMTTDFEEPKKIITGLSGCCGQMDIQCCGSELYVAENSRHRVVCYDRVGKQLRTFGSRMGQQDGQFGGCCNPMNLAFGKDGNVFTAESEGIVRQFTPAGKSLGAVGGCKLSGGCKNVAIGVSPDGDKVYFCDLPGSQIIVLARTASDSAEKTETSARD